MKFPTEVLPIKYQEIILETSQTLNFPKCFLGASMLVSTSIALGRSVKLQVKQGWNELPVLYLFVVGRRGLTKSPPMEFAINPLKQMDKNNEKGYKIECEDYERIMKMSKKQRAEAGYPVDVEKPILKQRLFTDATPEALTWGLHNNEKTGCGLFLDEATTWIGNFNRYSNSAEESMYLSFWSLSSYTVSRKTTHSYTVDPCLSIIGGIQPEVMENSLKNRVASGFMDRILCVYPKDLKMSKISNNQMGEEYVKEWENIINILIKLPSRDFHRERINYTEDAFKVFQDWQHKVVDMDELEEMKEFSGIHSKMVRYFHRFCLIIEGAKYACGESDMNNISSDTAMKAEILCEYFMETGRAMHNLVNYSKPVDFLTELQKEIYGCLPDKFKVKEAIDTIIDSNIDASEKTIRRLFSNEKVFKKIGHGSYEKL